MLIQDEMKISFSFYIEGNFTKVANTQVLNRCQAKFLIRSTVTNIYVADIASVATFIYAIVHIFTKKLEFYRLFVIRSPNKEKYQTSQSCL